MTKKSKILIIILLIILLLIAAFCVYYFVFAKSTATTPSENISTNQNLEENEIAENNVGNETNTENTVSNTVVTNTTNTSSEKTSVSEEPEEETKPRSTEPEIDELKELLETYSIGIQRIIYGGENLESNTILLYLAKQYFDGSTGKKNSLKVDTTYASTVKNIHKYLTELVGTNYNNVQYINSYKNYVGYSSGTNSYEYGPNISELKDEKYECPKLELTEEKNGVYTAKGEVIRISNNVETAYDITLTFQINQNYTYQKYQIVSLKSANKSFYPDNTAHLIENSSEVE